MEIINPANETRIADVAETSPAQARQMYEKARKAQPAWAALPLRERLACLTRFRHLLEEKSEILAATLSSEMGKPIWQANNELNGARFRIEYFLRHSERWLAEEETYQEGGLSEKISYEPLGVIANISAWNYPYLVGVNVFVPALIAGNAVLYKPSEYSSLTGLKIGQLLAEAGVPEAVFPVLIGARETGEALLDLPLDGYFFTGSYRTGQHIYQRVAPKMVPCQLELGGKDPLYVSADIADIASVAAAAAEGVFYNNGQSCCAVERLYVHKEVYEPFVEAFLAETKKLKIGDPTEEGVWIGPMARKEQLDFLRQQVADALAKGARLEIGGKAAEGPGYYFEPTVFTNVNHTMHLMTEESFGPIIGIMAVESDEEAIRLMADTEYGLTAAVYSDHRETAEPILRAMPTGTVYWNVCDRVSPYVPWSGRRHSGIGLTLSYQGIRAFTRVKAWQMRMKQ